MYCRGSHVTHNTVSLCISEVGFMVVTAKEPVEERHSFSFYIIFIFIFTHSYTVI